jgi:hypothetical protein
LPSYDKLADVPPSEGGRWEGALAAAFRGLLEDEGKRRLMGERARAVLEENRGATARTVELLAPLLKQKSDAGRPMLVGEKSLTSNTTACH